ncbi:MAG: peptidase M14 [Acidobacteria bacterium]|nr:peptidase M14 [Acidobacteriota bacterium]
MRSTKLLALLSACAVLAAAAPAADEDWTTPAEGSQFQATPSYQETLEYLARLAKHSRAIRVSSIGTSGQGRRIPLVIYSGDRAFTPAAAARTGKPVVLVVSSIHAGECDGKDASLMILRDAALGRPGPLAGATVLFLPIYNVDGHERVSPYNRPNQDGPREGMGFRTNATGLDLNRDHLKLASPEARAFARLVNEWRPQLHIDNHVTDGIDMDWVVTYATVEAPQAPPSVDAWIRAHLPKAVASAARAGVRSGPYVDLVDGTDPTKGFESWIGGARMSNGYMALRNRASVLIEAHSYKPYRERVLADRELLLALLAEVAADPDGLVDAVAAAERRTVEMGRPGAVPSDVVVEWKLSPQADRAKLPIYRWERVDSVALGRPVLRYQRGVVDEIEVPWFHASVPAATLPRPRGYFVLPGWPQIEERLAGHGLRFRRLERPLRAEVEVARLSEPKFETRSYQGLVGLKAKVERRRETRELPAGTLWVPADQPDFEVVVQLFEPDSPDSLTSWGLLDSVVERKEYIDPGVLDRLATEMLADPKVAAEWKAALEDPAFAADSQARYLWWYRRTPYWDEQAGLHPVFRALSPPGDGHR